MNRLISIFLVASFCTAAFAQNEIAKAKELVREGKCADGYIDYVKGANIAGFKKVADAMCQQGF